MRIRGCGHVRNSAANPLPTQRPARYDDLHRALGPHALECFAAASALHVLYVLLRSLPIMPVSRPSSPRLPTPYVPPFGGQRAVLGHRSATLQLATRTRSPSVLRKRNRTSQGAWCVGVGGCGAWASSARAAASFDPLRASQPWFCPLCCGSLRGHHQTAMHRVVAYST